MKKQRGEITEDQYQANLDELKTEQPWGGDGLGSQKEPPSIIFSK